MFTLDKLDGAEAREKFLEFLRKINLVFDERRYAAGYEYLCSVCGRICISEEMPHGDVFVPVRVVCPFGCTISWRLEERKSYQNDVARYSDNRNVCCH